MSYRLAVLGCLVCGLAAVTIPAGFAVGAPAAAQVSAGQVSAELAQWNERSRFSEIERRAAAQEGLSERDKAFLMTAAQSQMLQLEVSRVAIERTKNPQIRHFAEATVEFVGRAKEHLDGIAREFGMSLPKIPPEEVQNAHQALGKAADPDHEYLRSILADITKVSDLYKDESSNGKNPVLAQYAQAALPRLRQHYRNAHNLLAGRG